MHAVANIDFMLVRANFHRPQTPDDVAAALRAAGMTSGWEALTPGRRRGLLYQVATAKRAETRARRIATLVAGLADPESAAPRRRSETARQGERGAA